MISSSIVIHHSRDQPPGHDHNTVVHVPSIHGLLIRKRAEDYGKDQAAH